MRSYTYIKLSTLEYPRYEGDIRLEYPEITEDQTGPTFPCPPTYALVQDVPWPENTDPNKTIEELSPIQIDGVWTKQIIVRDMTEEEIKNRDEFLASLINPPAPPIPE